MSQSLRRFLVVAMGIFILIILLLARVGFGTVAVMLLFGWLSFLNRVVPAITVSWSGVGMVVLCSTLIVAGIHSFGGWAFRHAALALGRGPDVRWSWSWSASIYLSLWLLFGAIMGAVGIAHQVGWLLRSKEPLYQLSFAPPWESEQMKMAGDLRAIADAAGWNLEETRRRFFTSQMKLLGNGPNAYERLEVVLLPGKDGALAAGLILHREGKARELGGVTVVAPDSKEIGEWRPSQQFDQVLAQYRLPP